MSERSYKTFVEAMSAYPEMDDDERMDEYENDAIYRSSSIDLRDSLGNPDFRYIYPILIKDILIKSFERRKIFCQKMLERIEEVYDYKFPKKVELDSELGISEFLEFLKFLEYDNVLFLSFVWQYLNVDLLKLDIESFCNSNEDKILREVEEQLESHEQNQLISIFLRTNYKEKFIEWFIRETKRSKTQILLEILEREGKLNE